MMENFEPDFETIDDNNENEKKENRNYLLPYLTNEELLNEEESDMIIIDYENDGDKKNSNNLSFRIPIKREESNSSCEKKVTCNSFNADDIKKIIRNLTIIKKQENVEKIKCTLHGKRKENNDADYNEENEENFHKKQKIYHPTKLNNNHFNNNLINFSRFIIVR